MKKLMFILCTILVTSGCNQNDSLKKVTIEPKVFITGDTIFLNWNFKNNTDKNLIIPTQFTFRRLDGNDQNKYEFKKDYKISGFDNDRNRTIVVPYKYLRQIPDLSLDTALHNKVLKMEDFDDEDYIDKSDYDYLKNKSICPTMIFISAHSEKQLVFMFKTGIRGKYSIGFLDKKMIDRISTLRTGDSVWKKGFPRLKDVISNRIDGYELEYGEFAIDSIEVNLNSKNESLLDLSPL